MPDKIKMSKLSSPKSSKKKKTVETFIKKKSKGQKITMLTAYDYFTASLLDAAGVDALLVGDSASNVIHGHTSTIPMTMDIMIAHTAAVARGNKSSLLIGDMPFLSFQPSIETAINNAGRFLKEGSAEAVKIEGGIEIVETVKKVIDAGIPVMGHIGLTPQSIHRFGGPKVQGRQEKSQNYLKESALALEEAGCFSIVLELIQNDIATEITKSLKTAATIGIGAGPNCDGQVLVTNDILGLVDEGFKPKFMRQYVNLSPLISEAAEKFIEDVTSGEYPSKDESY